MDSQHLTSEDLDNNLLTEWPIQKIFYFSTEAKKNIKQVFTTHNSGPSFFKQDKQLEKIVTD